jgi:cytochrome c oxidase cbb3-type subunit I/II
MPRYPWLAKNDLNNKQLPAKINGLRALGTPYPAGFEDEALADLEAQAAEVTASLRNDGVEQEGLENKEIVALIAYLQRLGTDIKPQPQANE